MTKPKTVFRKEKKINVPKEILLLFRNLVKLGTKNILMRRLNFASNSNIKYWEYLKIIQEVL
jgi:hypothetical protein